MTKCFRVQTNTVVGPVGGSGLPGLEKYFGSVFTIANLAPAFSRSGCHFGALFAQRRKKKEQQRVDSKPM